MGAIPIGASMESPKKTETDPVEKRAEFILKRLGLSWEELEGKRVLDIGAGPADLALAAAKRNVEVVSIDAKMPENIPGGLEYVAGDAKDLPFQDESFDVVMAHAAPPAILADKNEVKKILGEVGRVLRPGGEFRFGPVSNANLFEDEELFTAEEEETFSTEQRVERVRQRSLDFYRSLNMGLDLVSQDGDFLVFKK